MTGLHVDLDIKEIRITKERFENLLGSLDNYKLESNNRVIDAKIPMFIDDTVDGLKVVFNKIK